MTLSKVHEWFDGLTRHDSSPGKTKLESGLTFLTFLQRSQLWADLGSGISRFSGPGRMARGTTGPHHRTFSEARLVCVSYDVLLQLLIHPCSLPTALILPIYSWHEAYKPRSIDFRVQLLQDLGIAIG